MRLKEVTIRKANRETVKSPEGSFSSHEADVSLTVEAEDGKLDELEVIERVKQLVQKTISDDADWIQPKLVEGKEVENGKMAKS